MTKSRGRRSVAADLSRVHAAIQVNERQQPDDDLTADEKDVWLTLVNARDPGWYLPEHRPLIRTYVQQLTIASDLVDRFRAIVRVLPRKPSVKDLKPYHEFIRMFHAMDNALARIGGVLRVTPSSLYTERKKRGKEADPMYLANRDEANQRRADSVRKTVAAKKAAGIPIGADARELQVSKVPKIKRPRVESGVPPAHMLPAEQQKTEQPLWQRKT